MIKVLTRCPICGKEHIIEVEKEKYDHWQAGELIQNVWPEMKAEDRELLITGICPTCWP